MFKYLLVSTLVAASFVLTPALAKDNNDNEVNLSGEYQKIILAENESDRTAEDKSSRGNVTQGVIGAQAEENKKLVPEESAAEKKEQDSPSNIRLPDRIEDDINSPSSEQK